MGVPKDQLIIKICSCEKSYHNQLTDKTLLQIAIKKLKKTKIHLVTSTKKSVLYV